MKLYISHGAKDVDGEVDWFIVEPHNLPERQVESLRKAGRTVYAIEATPFEEESEVINLRKRPQERPPEAETDLDDPYDD